MSKNSCNYNQLWHLRDELLWRRGWNPQRSLPTLIGTLRHPSPAHGDSLSGRNRRMNHPIILCSFRRHCILHLCLDEEFQDVVVFLALVNVATVSSITTHGLRTQYQATVVQTPLRGFIHDMEPGPRLHHTTYVILSLILLLQILDLNWKQTFSEVGSCLPKCWITSTLYLVRRLSHFLAICSDVSLPSRPRPFRMVLGNKHTGVSKRVTCLQLFEMMGYIPPCYLSRISLPGEECLIGCPELDQSFHILFTHWQLRGQRSQNTCI